MLKLLGSACVLLAAWPVAALGEQPASTNRPTAPFVAPASGEAQLAIKRFQAPPGFKIDLWAAEPMLANPVTFTFDEKGRAYVCETFRLGAGVDDIRGIMSWLDEERAARTVDDREAVMKRHLGDRFATYTEKSERIRLLEDRSGQGKADRATVFADGFNTPLDGLGAGILAWKGNVWYANIPNLWLLRDHDGDGASDSRQSLHYGFGVRVGFLGHDLHGPRFGPDGKLYFSVGDRGSNVRVGHGQSVGNPDTGCVFRCNPDGSNLEVFAFGLRNPQDLVFDQFGNLFTGDNNSDSGDQARWVYLVEGGDSGWRVGYQFMEKPYSRGPFNAERLWHPPFPGQAANIVPPIANLASGPSGLSFYPGTGLPARYQNPFFLVDFRGGSANSGVHSFTLQPKGAGFDLSAPEHFLWGILATDAKFGVDGGLYVSDWVEGWGMTGKGRIYRVHAPELDADPAILETKRWLARDLDALPMADLAELLLQPDQRVRQEAQFALARHGAAAVPILTATARRSANQLARLHAIWALGQVESTRQDPSGNGAAPLEMLVRLLADADAEVRAQTANVLGECRYRGAREALTPLLRDPQPRVRFFAALSLGKLGDRQSVSPVLAFLKANADMDPFLRHAGVMALTWIGDADALLRAAADSSPAVRMGVLLALRRLHRPELALFLQDPEPALVLEAARAINDEPINGAIRDLAALIERPAFNLVLAARDSALAAEPTATPAPATPTENADALARRVLNANFHFGTAASAEALARFAARQDVPTHLRVEAIEELGDWEHPSGRDRVVGLWRPVAAVRSSETAARALQPRLNDLLTAAPEPVGIALARAVARLRLAVADPILAAFVAQTNRPGSVRAAALDSLADLGSPALESLLDSARTDPSEALRRAATRLESRMMNGKSITRLSAALETGAVAEQQTALAALAQAPGEVVDDLLGEWLNRLRDGRVPNELQLDLLDAAAQRTAPSVKRKLDRYLRSRDQNDPLAGFQETLFGGNAAEGKKLFFDKPETQCVRCHRIDAEGGDVGPNLSRIGAEKDRRYLLESILQPNQRIAQGFESVLVTLKNDETYAGVLRSESADELTLSSADTGLLSVKKSEIESRRTTLSPMPEGLGQILSKHELRDLIEYLSTMQGAGQRSSH